MAERQYRFICLDPRKAKKEAVTRVLSPLGEIDWRRLPPMRFGDYPETSKRVGVAFDAATKKPASGLGARAKRALLGLQYNGTRALFERNRDAVAVAWNGLNGTRRVFMDAARDAGARTLYFELCPFPDRITVDPCGVNFHNGLPRTTDPYLAWADARADTVGWRALGDTITARQPTIQRSEVAPERPLSEPFVFVPLQVPGDSQLRLFGGAFRTVESVIEGVAQGAKALPDGWHARLKEHPSAPHGFRDLFERVKHPKIALDNATDTFVQVAAARAVVTVNSSVGLEAMFYEKPVIALGDCFWAIPGIAGHCPTTEALAEALADPEALTFDPAGRAAFLSFLAEEYYPRLLRDEAGGALPAAEIEKVRARLNGANALGFWACQGDAG